MASSGQAQTDWDNPSGNDRCDRNLRKWRTIMNNKLTLTALTVAAIGIGLATSAPARAASGLLDQCHFNNSRQVLEKCCNTWVRQRGKPMWFDTGSSCSSVVACSRRGQWAGISAVAYAPKCRIEIPFDGGSSTPPSLRKRKG